MPSPHFDRVRDQVGNKRRHLLPEMPAPAAPREQQPAPPPQPDQGAPGQPANTA